MSWWSKDLIFDTLNPLDFLVSLYVLVLLVAVTQ